MILSLITGALVFCIGVVVLVALLENAKWACRWGLTLMTAGVLLFLLSLLIA